MNNSEAISREFTSTIQSIFSNNLIFGFLFGGIAKGYASSSLHDIDMFICVDHNPTDEEISQFKNFYDSIHKKWGYESDNVYPGEIITYKELKNILNKLDSIIIEPVIVKESDYVSIVYGDIFSAKTIGHIGNFDILEDCKKRCQHLPLKWRESIMNFIPSNELKLYNHEINQLNITRLFRRFVVYLKRPDDFDINNPHCTPLNICILGGGGNVAEALSANLIARGHCVRQFRLNNHLDIPGVPQRPKRSQQRLDEILINNVSGQYCKVPEINTRVNWIVDLSDFATIDVFIYAYPSYMAEKIITIIGDKIKGRPLINLSDRFLGSYSILCELKKKYSVDAFPSFVVGFNGVPIMALKSSRDAPSSIYYVKPKHSISWYPQVRKTKADCYNLLIDLFGFKPNQLVPYKTMFHLAFENTHCIEHAVADLYNIKQSHYQEGRYLYSDQLYSEDVVKNINEIVSERDLVAEFILKQRFASLKDYDIKVFGNSVEESEQVAGTHKYRIQHSSLSKAPSLLPSTAFGYEDIGWSMVTLESFAKFYNIITPKLSYLIDQWNDFMKVDYRKVGRTIETLDLITNGDVKNLNWLPNFFPEPYPQ